MTHHRAVSDSWKLGSARATHRANARPLPQASGDAKSNAGALAPEVFVSVPDRGELFGRVVWSEG